MKYIIIIIAFLLVVPIQSCSEKNSTAESFGRELMGIWQNGNIEDLQAIVSENAVYEAAQQNQVYKGLEQFGGYVGHLSKFAKDLKIDIISLTSSS